MAVWEIELGDNGRISRLRADTCDLRVSDGTDIYIHIYYFTDYILSIILPYKPPQ